MCVCVTRGEVVCVTRGEVVCETTLGWQEKMTALAHVLVSLFACFIPETVTAKTVQLCSLSC